MRHNITKSAIAQLRQIYATTEYNSFRNNCAVYLLKVVDRMEYANKKSGIKYLPNSFITETYDISRHFLGGMAYNFENMSVDYEDFYAGKSDDVKIHNFNALVKEIMVWR